ncbi:hypothetical protein OEZ86_012159 [Tetradesmus obliquus]|nr:hypothetical protein OEZ86_012159 [Tetradesmus obliquus]
MDALFRQLADDCCTPSSTTQDVAVGLADRLEGLHLSPAAAQVVTRARHHADSPEPAATAAGCSHAAAHLPTAAQQQQQYRLFTFDLETTGLSQEYDAIIEMAAVDVVSGSSWSSLVRPAPYKKSAQRAFDAHGITDAELRQPGVPQLPSAWAGLLAFMARYTPPGAQPVLAAHNGFAFDFKMLAACLLRAQQQQQQQQQQGTSTAGSTVVEHFLGAAPAVCHRALADAQQLALMLPLLLRWAASQAGSGLDEALLPRKLASFGDAAAAKARGAQAAKATSAAAAATAAAAAAAAAEEGNEGPVGSYEAAAAAAAAAAGLAPDVLSGHVITLRGRSVPVLTSAAFVQLAQASGSSSSSSSSSSSAASLRLGAAVAGKADSFFQDVLLGPQGLPVVLLLEGLQVSKELRLRNSSIDEKAASTSAAAAAATLLLKGASRAQQQHVRQLAAAVDSLTALLHRGQTQQQQQQQEQQQQQQQQRLFTCLSGASLQVRLPCSKPGPVILQQQHGGSSSSSSSMPAVLPVPSPQSQAAEAALQQLLPAGCAVSVLLCPCSVWANSKCVGVTLNCLQVLKL